VTVTCLTDTSGVLISFTGDPQSFDQFVTALRGEGLEPRYETPTQRRTGGQDLLSVVITLAEDARSELVGIGVGVALERARAKVHARFPRTRIEVDEPPEPGGDDAPD
jgi:hypothetical protein